METQTRLSRHNKFISAENIIILCRNKFIMTTSPSLSLYYISSECEFCEYPGE